MLAIQLWDAVRGNDRVATNRIIAKITPLLVAYLVHQMGASEDDAMEVVQNTMLYICDGIRSGRIRKEPGLFNYMQKTCRHSYLKMLDGRRRTPTIDTMVQEVASETEEEQLQKLLDEEKDGILSLCVSEMKEENQKLFYFLLENPEMSAEEVGLRFHMSPNAVWARKHRIITYLRRCTKSRLNR